MTFIGTIAPAEARDDVAQMYRKCATGWGFVPSYAQAFCHRPAVMQRWGALLAELKRPLDERRLELVTFVAAHALRSSPCALAHGRILRKFFADAQIVALADGRYEHVLSPADAALARFAATVARDATQVEASDVALLASHGFSDAEIFDVAAVVAGRAFFTKVLDAMGVEPDAPFADLPSPLREALIVGRPVGAGPCRAMPAEDGRAAPAAA